MKARIFGILACLSLFVSCGTAAWTTADWHKIPADGHRTGVTAPVAGAEMEALGVSNGKFYSSPGGKVFVGGATPQVAQILFSTQEEMADLKTVVGHSREGMSAYGPESPLSNWTVDVLMEEAAKLTGKKIDVGITNFGGIRTSIPQGEILKDDLVSMFPFKNYVTVVALRGSRLREIFQQMASTSVQCVGGAKLTIKDHQLESALVGGKPIDDNALYNVATVDFLLNGGDKYFLGDGAEKVEITKALVIDVMLPRVIAAEAAGKTIDYQTDGRIVIIK